MQLKKPLFGLIAATCILALAGSAPARADVVTYTIDPAHSSVSFAVKHMVVTNVRGGFDKFEGKILYDAEDITESSVEVTIDAASIDTENEKRDQDLRGEGFLSADQFPTITFKSKSVREDGDGFVVTGDLTIRGVTKEVEFPFVLAGPVTNPWGTAVIGVMAELEINRQDYGVSWNKALDNGGVLVSDTVKIELNVEALPADA